MTRAHGTPNKEEVASSPPINGSGTLPINGSETLPINGSETPLLEFETARDIASAAAAELGGEARLAPDLEEIQTWLPIGLVLVDEAGLILWRNNHACDALSAGCGIEERLGKIRIERASLDRTLHENIQAHIGGEPGADAPLAIGVPDRDGRMHYVLRLFRVRATEDPPSIVIAIVDLVNGSSVNRITAAKVFNLSKRESEFAELFSEGLCIEEIAPRMGVASNTARIHLRNVFAKTGCSNQIELARVLARTATLVSCVPS